MNTRRNFLKSALAVGSGLAVSARALTAQQTGTQHEGMPPGMQMGPKQAMGRERAASHPLQVETPDVPQLPWRMDAGVKEFHLVAEPEIGRAHV